MILCACPSLPHLILQLGVTNDSKIAKIMLTSLFGCARIRSVSEKSLRFFTTIRFLQQKASRIGLYETKPSRLAGINFLAGRFHFRGRHGGLFWPLFRHQAARKGRNRAPDAPTPHRRPACRRRQCGINRSQCDIPLAFPLSCHYHRGCNQVSVWLFARPARRAGWPGGLTGSPVSLHARRFRRCPRNGDQRDPGQCHCASHGKVSGRLAEVWLARCQPGDRPGCLRPGPPGFR